MNAGSEAEENGVEWLLDAFLDNSLWLTPFLPNPSRLGVVEWLLRHADRFSLGGVVLGSPVHAEAERGLIAFMKRAQRLEKNVSDIRASRQITRYTDWAKTLSASVGNSPTLYFERMPKSVLDIPFLRSAVGLATSWCTALQANGYYDRAEALAGAIATMPLQCRTPNRFGLIELKKLRELDRPLATNIQAVLDYWRELLEDDLQFRKLLRSELSQDWRDRMTRERDPLMETVVLTSIVRAAVENPESNWRLIPLQWKSVSDKPKFCLESHDLTCVVSKSVEAGGDFKDHYVSVLRSMGINSTGFQPDVVLRFEKKNDSTGGVIYAMGDSKRNQSRDGVDYIKSSIKGTATAYFYGFRPLFGVHPETYESMMNPAVTLFLYQGIGSIAGHSVADELSVITELLESKRTMPNIIGFDRHQIYPDSTLLRLWFERLARQALATLDDGLGFFPPT